MPPTPTTPGSGTPCEQARERFKGAQDKLRQIESLGNEVRVEMREAREGLAECLDRDRRDKEAAIARQQADLAAIDRMSEGPLFVWESGASRAEVNTSGLRRLLLGGGSLFSGIGGTLIVLLLLGTFDGKPVVTKTVTVTERVEIPAPAPEWPRPLVEFRVFDTKSRRALLSFLNAHPAHFFPEQAAFLRSAAALDNVILRYRVEHDGTLTPVDPRPPTKADEAASESSAY